MPPRGCRRLAGRSIWRGRYRGTTLNKHRHRPVDRADYAPTMSPCCGRTPGLMPRAPAQAWRNTQKLGDYVLAHGMCARIIVLDQELPLWAERSSALAEMQVALGAGGRRGDGPCGFE